MQTTIHTLRLFGGVDLTVTPRLSSNNDRVPRVTAAVRAARARYRDTAIFAVTLDGQRRYAKVLAINPSGQALWRSQPKAVLALAR